MGKALANLAIDVQKLTGALDEGAHAVKSFELANGVAVNSLADLDAAIRDLRERSQDVSLWETS